LLRADRIRFGNHNTEDRKLRAINAAHVLDVMYPLDFCASTAGDSAIIKSAAMTWGLRNICLFYP
jgi:hypothetical protein